MLPFWITPLDGLYDAVDVLVIEKVLVALLAKLVRSIHEEHGIVALRPLTQDDDAGGDAHPKEEVGGELNDGVYQILLQQVVTNLLLGTTAVEHTGELDDSSYTTLGEMVHHVHRKGEVGLRLGGQHTSRCKTLVVDQHRVFLAIPLGAVGWVADDGVELLS